MFQAASGYVAVSALRAGRRVAEQRIGQAGPALGAEGQFTVVQHGGVQRGPQPVGVQVGTGEYDGATTSRRSAGPAVLQPESDRARAVSAVRSASSESRCTSADGLRWPSRARPVPHP